MAGTAAARGVSDPQRSTARLMLDEMFSPLIAANLRERGSDVVAVVDRADLRSLSDEVVFGASVAEKRWLVTENVRDFRPILLSAMQGGAPITGILFTSSRSFPRSRQNSGPLVEALDAWLKFGPPSPPLTEDWLVGDAA